jgi:predicted nucleotidyltransferase
MKELKKIIERIKGNPRVIGIYLFGSLTKKERKPISDMDIAVILKNWTKEDEAEIGSHYSKSVDLVLFHRLPLFIQFEVFRYGKEIYVKDEDFILELKVRVLREYLENVRFYEFIKKETMK